jgi:hypothetical protein
MQPTLLVQRNKYKFSNEPVTGDIQILLCSFSLLGDHLSARPMFRGRSEEDTPYDVSSPFVLIIDQSYSISQFEIQQNRNNNNKDKVNVNTVFSTLGGWEVESSHTHVPRLA